MHTLIAALALGSIAVGVGILIGIVRQLEVEVVDTRGARLVRTNKKHRDDAFATMPTPWGLQ